MGDRGNIVIVQHPRGADPDGAIYLYTHWGGSYIARTAQCALERGRDRWDDEPYIGRIVFNELTAGLEMDTQSFGVTTYLTDNEHDLVVLDAAKQTVAIESPDGTAKQSFPFADFVKLDLAQAGLVPERTPCGLAEGGGHAPTEASGAWSHLAVFLAGACALLLVGGAVRRRVH
jgi:hypothetical protein